MQDVKVYILVEDKQNEAEVRIDGNLALFKELLTSLNADPIYVSTLLDRNTNPEKESEPARP